MTQGTAEMAQVIVMRTWDRGLAREAEAQEAQEALEAQEVLVDQEDMVDQTERVMFITIGVIMILAAMFLYLLHQ